MGRSPVQCDQHGTEYVSTIGSPACELQNDAGTSIRYEVRFGMRKEIDQLLYRDYKKEDLEDKAGNHK